MGNCADAFVKRKVRSIEITSDDMIHELEIQENTHRCLSQETDAAIKRTQQSYDGLVRLIKQRRSNPTPTASEKSQLKLWRTSIFLREKQQVVTNDKLIGLEASKMELQNMRANTKLLVSKQKLVKGYKKLKNKGIDTNKADAANENALEDAEEMKEFNRIFEGSGDTQCTPEETDSIDASIENEFNPPPRSITVKVPSVPTRNLESRVTNSEQEPYEEQEIELEMTTD